MKKVLLALGVLAGSLGLYGLADAAQTVIGTTVLGSDQSLNVTCASGRLHTTWVSVRSVTDTCWGRGIEHAWDPSTTTTSTTDDPPTTTTSTTDDPPTTTTSTTDDPSTTTTSTTLAPPVATGGNCTSPVYSTSDAQGTYNTDPDDGAYYWVNNDAWSGSHGPQTVNVCSESSWDAVSDQPNDGGQVETYPDTEYDVGGRDNPSTTPISGYPDGSITSTFSEAYPSDGGWDAAYDLWTNNWTNETMIWNQWAGDNSYWPSQATISLTLDGVPYKFYDNGGELMFFRDTQVSSGSVDIAAAFQWEVANGYASASDVPTQLEYGVEVSYTNGTETFPMTGLTFSLG